MRRAISSPLSAYSVRSGEGSAPSNRSSTSLETAGEDGRRGSITQTGFSAQGTRRLMRLFMITGMRDGFSGPMELADIFFVLL